MKLFLKLIVLMLIAALAAPFFIKGPTGAPLANWRAVPAWFAGMKTRAGRLVDKRHSAITVVYRWQDENGNWHYSDTEPLNTDSELIYIDGGANTYQAPVYPTQPTPSTPAQPGLRLPTPLSVPTDELGELIDDAHEARRAE